jgi:hypothetical protein
MFIRKSLALASLFAAAYAHAGNYYCPMANVLLREIRYPDFSSGLAGGGVQFPTKMTDLDIEPRKLSLNLVGADCSTEDFECIKYTEYFGTTKKGNSFFLFSPKTLKRHKEYHFNDMVLIAENARVTSGFDNGAIQATIWQNISGKRRPIKLTFQQSRGVIYIDGMRIFEGSEFSNSCALLGDTGIFPNVTVQPLVDVKTKNSDRID